jgi:A/G-specific adenine glycosylase
MRILVCARGEIEEACGWYEAQAPGLGERFMSEFEHGLKRVQEFPRAWHPIKGNIRRYRMGVFPTGSCMQSRNRASLCLPLPICIVRLGIGGPGRNRASGGMPMSIGAVAKIVTTPGGTDGFCPAPTALGRWFRAEGRELPWRDAPHGRRDPWRTLVSEVMSQQTRLEVVVPRFLRWMEIVPSAQGLAALPEDEVLSLWAGLGYYNRARNLHRLARQVSDRGWPQDFLELKELPGVGDYTAAAIASLCHGERVAAVDGNVERVLARIHRIEGDLRTGAGKRAVREAAAAWVAQEPAGMVNEATMELGALVCVPRRPRCQACPCAPSCAAHLTGSVEHFPQVRRRAATVEVVARVAAVRGPRGILLRQAGEDELLAGHWTLPRLGIDLTESDLADPFPCGTVRHAITHHRIVWEVMKGSSERAFPGICWVPEAELPARIVSSLPRKALVRAGIGFFD